MTDSGCSARSLARLLLATARNSGPVVMPARSVQVCSAVTGRRSGFPARGRTRSSGCSPVRSVLDRFSVSTRPLACSATSSTSRVKTLLHSVYDQPDADSVHAQFDRLAEAVTDKLPKVGEHLEDDRADVLAFTAFPRSSGAAPTSWGSSPTATP